MSDYQVIARKFRPQSFKEVMGQEAIVTTLKNAIQYNRLAQAYLFCGSRGTGKTTLARILAKALNCQQPTSEYEPCNDCSSCREITSGSSLDVLEIDGASHRGIEDIRQINETVGYAAACGGYKIYIIDEVHMLTKEAFNALLKTLEEPPPKVKFFFATTEPHKVLPTILSRCQRFNLNRISLSHIATKLRLVAGQLGVEVDEEALQLISQRAEGGLRDAESLFDQILAFSNEKITVSCVQSILGIMPREAYFELDRAGKRGDFGKAFEIANRLFEEGKDLAYFIEGLIDHFRSILLMQLSGKESSLLNLSAKEKKTYEEIAHFYSQEQCLDLIDYLLESAQAIRFAHSGKMALEAILLHVMRSHYRLPIEVLVRRLSALELALGDLGSEEIPAITAPPPLPKMTMELPKTPPPPLPKIAMELTKTVPAPPIKNFPPKAPPSTPGVHSISEDPTPTRADLGLAVKKAAVPAPVKTISSNKPVEPPAPSDAGILSSGIAKAPAYLYDTLFQFAATELEGRLQRKA
ncbi:MAG: DNA polymerase III subunit gamma/tau [Candidatus Protochlamydia sp.]|nr:DNA polymerase III subunit gamma/tau [Candidatus Protochlamydia sp.]